MASNTSGSFTTNLAAGSSSADKYTMTLSYSYTHSASNNKTSLTISGTIKSNNSSYTSYKSSSSNTVYVKYNNSSGTSVLSKSPTTAYDCRNLGSTQIFSYTVDVPHDTSGNRVVYIYWSFDGLQSTWNPTGTVSGTVTFPQSTFTISYNANGGSGAPSSQTKTYGTALALSSTIPTYTGYTFKGWGTSSTSTTVSYSAGSSYTTEASTTLYAVWTENVLTVNYYSNYATEAFEGALNTVSKSKNVLVYTESYKYTKGNEYGLRDYSSSDSDHYLKRTGYKGTGYYGSKPDGGTLLSETQSFSTGQELAEIFGLSLKTSNASLNIYPQWKAQNIAYKKINNEYTLCFVYVKVNGTWQPAITYVKNNGTYKQSIV